MKIRLITSDDIEPLMELIKDSGPGLTNLPYDRTKLLEKIKDSEKTMHSSANTDEPLFYFFVLEDTDTGKIAGCCGIINKIGISQPFYSLQILNITHTSRELNHYEPVQMLQMVEEHRGDAEVMMLYLDPKYRKDGNGQLLSYSRFLFISQFLEYFPENIIAEMRGCVTDEGDSPFWNNLGGRFIPLDFMQADKFNAVGHYQFISDLMPKYPIYVRLLSDEATNMIGKTHAQTVPAVKLLEGEGFRPDGTIDVFDAGPVMKCPTKQLRTVRHSKLVTIEKIVALEQGRSNYLACTTELACFGLCRAQVSFIEHASDDSDKNSIAIDAVAAKKLGVKVGDEIRVHLLAG